MIHPLDQALLRTGERLDISVICAPEPGCGPEILTLLGHKGYAYQEHLRRALEGPLDFLQTRFYVGRITGEVVAQVMVVGDRGAGILGHVYTRPEHRRKGICRELFSRLIPDTEQAGFRVLCLGTGYDTPPYWIYHAFGFRPVAEQSGLMKRVTEPEAEGELLKPAPARIRSLRWDDWGYADLLAMAPVGEDECLPRSALWGIAGQGSAEGPFVTFQVRKEGEARAQALVAETATGATVGWALLCPDPRWFGGASTVDLHAHPDHTPCLAELAAGLRMPDEPVVALLSRGDGARAAACAALGLKPAMRLPGALGRVRAGTDLVLWTNSSWPKGYSLP